MELDSAFETRGQHLCYVWNMTCSLPPNKRISNNLEDLISVVTRRYMLNELRYQHLTSTRPSLILWQGFHIETQHYVVARDAVVAEWVECAHVCLDHLLRRLILSEVRYPFLDSTSFRTHLLLSVLTWWRCFIRKVITKNKWKFASKNNFFKNSNLCCIRIRLKHCCRITSFVASQCPCWYTSRLCDTHGCPVDGMFRWYISVT